MPDATATPARPMTAAVDVMGGDLAPQAVLEGCLSADLGPDDRVLLVGDERVIRPALDAADLGGRSHHFDVLHADEVIAMGESPVEALRHKKRSSIASAVGAVTEGRANVFLSAGNTGACVAASHLKLRTLPGVSRPGIAVVIPTHSGPVVLCDAGANTDPQPHHLLHYALMAAAYARAVCGVASPRVGLVNVGGEASKGNELAKEAHALLASEVSGVSRMAGVTFAGNLEGRDFFRGVADVAVADGFVGNVLLKGFEGMFESLLRTVAAHVQEAAPHLFDDFRRVMGRVKQSHDWQEYGAAPLLGVNGYTLIAHGASDARTIKNALAAGRRLVQSDVNRAIVEAIGAAAEVAA